MGRLSLAAHGLANTPPVSGRGALVVLGKVCGGRAGCAPRDKRKPAPPASRSTSRRRARTRQPPVQAARPTSASKLGCRAPPPATIQLAGGRGSCATISTASAWASLIRRSASATMPGRAVRSVKLAAAAVARRSSVQAGRRWRRAVSATSTPSCEGPAHQADCQDRGARRRWFGCELLGHDAPGSLRI